MCTVLGESELTHKRAKWFTNTAQEVEFMDAQKKELLDDNISATIVGLIFLMAIETKSRVCQLNELLTQVKKFLAFHFMEIFT